MVCKKTQNLTRQGSLLKVVKVDQFPSSIWQGFFYVENLPSSNTTDSLFLGAISLQSKSFSYLFLMFRKEFAIILFLSAMSERQESIIKESLKFTDKIYKILKSFKRS